MGPLEALMEAPNRPSGQPWGTQWRALGRAARKAVNFFSPANFEFKPRFLRKIPRGNFIKPKGALYNGVTMKRTTKQIKRQQLWYRLSLTPQILELATEEEKAHGEAELRKRSDARIKLINFRIQKNQGVQPQPMYNATFWDTHAQYNNADWAIRGLRAVLRLRYSKTLKEGLYKTTKTNTYTKTRTGLFGKGRGHYIQKGALLMWVERDEFGDNWFLDLNENKLIVCIKGAALQNVIPVPPEEEQS